MRVVALLADVLRDVLWLVFRARRATTLRVAKRTRAQDARSPPKSIALRMNTTPSTPLMMRLADITPSHDLLNARQIPSIVLPGREDEDVCASPVFHRVVNANGYRAILPNTDSCRKIGQFNQPKIASAKQMIARAEPRRLQHHITGDHKYLTKGLVT